MKLKLKLKPEGIVILVRWRMSATIDERPYRKRECKNGGAAEDGGRKEKGCGVGGH